VALAPSLPSVHFRARPPGLPIQAMHAPSLPFRARPVHLLRDPLQVTQSPSLCLHVLWPRQSANTLRVRPQVVPTPRGRPSLPPHHRAGPSDASQQVVQAPSLLHRNHTSRQRTSPTRVQHQQVVQAPSHRPQFHPLGISRQVAAPVAGTKLASIGLIGRRPKDPRPKQHRRRWPNRRSICRNAVPPKQRTPSPPTVEVLTRKPNHHLQSPSPWLRPKGPPKKSSIW